MQRSALYFILGILLGACTVPTGEGQDPNDEGSTHSIGEGDAAAGDGPLNGQREPSLADSGGDDPDADRGAGGDGAGGIGGGLPAQGGSGGVPTIGGMGPVGGTAGSGGMGATGGVSDIPPLSPDPARFHFEQGLHRWRDLPFNPGGQTMGMAPSRSGDRSYTGAFSLRYDINTPSGSQQRAVGVTAKEAIGPLEPGMTVTFQVWVPPGHKITQLQAFAETATGPNRVTDSRNENQLTAGAGAWLQLRLRIPNTYAGKEAGRLGVRFTVAGPWTGTVYIDSVNVE